jgi:type II restriction/modification system DNA methylase subunit YeeA
MDAILAYDDDGKPVEPEWQAADVIVGNPPFLGDKKMLGELGEKYVSDLRWLYRTRLPGQSDLVCYWFEKARQIIANGMLKRAV